MSDQIFDNRLRPAVEFFPAFSMIGAAILLLVAPGQLFPYLPTLARSSALILIFFGLIRAYQGYKILRYRSNLRKLPRYVLDGEHIPFSKTKMFVGRGFRWDQRHSQRLVEARSPASLPYLKQGIFYRAARLIENYLETRHVALWLSKLLSSESIFNPVRPLPPVGGNPEIHGVGMEDEEDVYWDLSERVGHTIVMGTTRVGKTRLAELFISQDIRRGEIVIMLDPKGDIQLLFRMYAEAKRAGRLHHFHIFHLGYPDFSELYNPVGEFDRITEVAGRTTSQLPREGNSAAFAEFAWRYTNIVAGAVQALGRKPDYRSIARFITNVEPLFVEFMHDFLDRKGSATWKQEVASMAGDSAFQKSLPKPLQSRDSHVAALAMYYKRNELYDPVAEGLLSIVEHDKTHFDKLTASLLPLLEKLTTGKSGELLTPRYTDSNEKRPVLDWRKVIREGGIVYVGLDALSDAEVASAVGNSMFADLTSVAGMLYKFGDARGFPGELNDGRKRPKIALHGDELNELMSDQFIPMVNKAGGAGIQVTGYTQTSDDVEAGIGSRAKAGQVFGNFNSLFMLRVQNEATARLLTDKLDTVRLYTKVIESRTSDNTNPDSPVEFESQNADRITEKEVEKLTPADLMMLPKGQAFALLNGGQLYKLRLPLAGYDPLMPKSLQEIREERLKAYGAVE